MTRVLVVVSLEPWDDVWRRNQHLVARLLRDDATLQVLFVEPPRDLSLAVARRRLPRPGRGMRRGPTERLWLHEPTKWLPRRLDPGFDRRRARRLLRAAGRLGDPAPAVWINDLGGAALADPRFDARRGRLLYDVTDDWLAATRPAAELARLAAAESDLLARADVVTVCSPALAASKGAGLGAGVVLIRNGVDLDAYRDPGPRPSDLPPGPAVVYAGTLHADRLDVDLCVDVAHALAGAPGGGALVLVGPVLLAAGEVTRLRAAGVVLTGPRPFATVPAYLVHAAALVVPHRVDPFTDSLDPIKLYEYLAAGRPIVSTPVAGFRDVAGTPGAGHVTVVPAEDLPAAVVRAVARPAGERFAAPAALPTWETQAALMRAALAG